MQGDFSLLFRDRDRRFREQSREIIPLNFDHPFPLVHRPATRTFREVVIGEVLEDVVTDTANDEVFAALVLPSLPENLGGDPSEEKGAEDPDEIYRDHSIQGHVKHGSL